MLLQEYLRQRPDVAQLVCLFHSMPQDIHTPNHLLQRSIHMQVHQRPTIPSTSTMPSFLALPTSFRTTDETKPYSKEFEGMNRPDIRASPFSTYGPTNTPPTFQSKQGAQLIPSHTRANLSNASPSRIRPKRAPDSLPSATKPQRFSPNRNEKSQITQRSSYTPDKQPQRPFPTAAPSPQAQKSPATTISPKFTSPVITARAMTPKLLSFSAI